jgi:hypothetical protein
LVWFSVLLYSNHEGPFNETAGGPQRKEVRMLGAIISILAGLCGVMGILTAVDVFTVSDLGYIFWFVLAAILFLATIAMNSGRGE